MRRSHADFCIASSFYGGDYWLAEHEGSEVRVLRNYVEDDGELFEPGARDGEVLLLIDGSPPRGLVLELDALSGSSSTGPASRWSTRPSSAPV